MKDNLLQFYSIGVGINLILALAYVKLSTKRYSGHFKKNVAKVNIHIDLFGNVDPKPIRIVSSFFYIFLNILMSWVFVPFNLIILFVRIYSNYSEEFSQEVEELNNRLRVENDLAPEEVFVLFQLCNKAIIPNIFCKAEIMHNLEQYNQYKQLELCPVLVESHLDRLIQSE